MILIVVIGIVVNVIFDLFVIIIVIVGEFFKKNEEGGDSFWKMIGKLILYGFFELFVVVLLISMILVFCGVIFFELGVKMFD